MCAQFFEEKNDKMNKPHDSWAKYYDFVYEHTFGDFYNSLKNETLKVITEILSDGTIIDYGAGTGRLTIPLAKKDYKVIAVEKSHEMVNELKRKLRKHNLDLPIHNCTISSYTNGRAELALAVFTVLSYCTTENELLESIKNICQHIKPEGYFFFDLPNHIFFNTEQLINIQSEYLNRSVKLIKNSENNIFTYEEICNGIFKNEYFSYEDRFQIRYWEFDEINKLLINNGLGLIDKEFPQFESTGSTYKLYKKI